MKTFSSLPCKLAFVSICLALVLVGHTVDGQLSYELRIAGVTRANYKKNDTPTITYTLVDSNGVPQRGVTMSLMVTGAHILTPGRVTNAVGQLIVQVEILANMDATLRATPQPLSRYGIRSEITFNVVKGPPERPARIVVSDPTPKSRLAVGDSFTQTIEIRDANDLASWQMDIAFNSEILEVGEVTEGDFLEQGGINALFLTENSPGKITVRQFRINRVGNQVRLGPVSGVSGTGVLVALTFRFVSLSDALLSLHNVRLSNSSGERLSYEVTLTPVVATHIYPAVDVNQDGQVDIRDLLTVASSIGTSRLINPRVDVNDDGIADILDLTVVAGSPHWGKAVAPQKVREPNAAAPAASVANLTLPMIQGWISLAQIEDDGSAIFDLGIANLESLLASRIPNETRLLLNYPNPFNPETWIPYQLAESTDVTVTIHSVNGSLIRTLALGHQAAGLYQSKSQAAYWDGRNEFGEQVASGLYFYTLTAGNFSATGKMLVRK